MQAGVAFIFRLVSSSTVAFSASHATFSDSDYGVFQVSEQRSIFGQGDERVQIKSGRSVKQNLECR
jgi:hypothetical protein